MNRLKAAAQFLLTVSLLSNLVMTLPAESKNKVKYTVTDIGTLGGAESRTAALNNAGQVVGFSDIITPIKLRAIFKNPLSHAFLWKNGKIEDLDVGTNTDVSGAHGINNAGQCVGESDAGGSPPYGGACLWNGNHRQFLRAPSIDFSMADSINDKGQVCGEWQVPGNGIDHAFLWEKGKLLDLAPIKDERSDAMCINDQGQMAGWIQKSLIEEAVLWSHGQMQILGSMPGDNFSEAYGINSGGTVVGACGFGSAKGPASAHRVRAFVWTTHKGMVGLKTPGDRDSRAGGINSRDQIVGHYDVTPNVSHACLWTNGIMADLNDFIPAHSGWILQSAKAINDHGQIAGTGLINGKRHAFLLTPKPE